MAEVSEIEAGGEVRTIKDATARNGVAANAAAIDEIETVIPSTASTSNQLTTASDLANKMDKPPLSARTDVIAELAGKHPMASSPISWVADRQGFIKIHYLNSGAGNTIALNIDGVLADTSGNNSQESDSGLLFSFVRQGQTVTVISDVNIEKIIILTAVIQAF